MTSSSPLDMSGRWSDASSPSPEEKVWERGPEIQILNRPVPHYVAELVSGVLCIPVEARIGRGEGKYPVNAAPRVGPERESPTERNAQD
jgi:hypothetical protein